MPLRVLEGIVSREGGYRVPHEGVRHDHRGMRGAPRCVGETLERKFPPEKWRKGRTFRGLEIIKGQIVATISLKYLLHSHACSDISSHYVCGHLDHHT